MRSVFVNSPPPKPEVILTNFFAEPTVLLVRITSRADVILVQKVCTNTSHVTFCIAMLKDVIKVLLLQKGRTIGSRISSLYFTAFNGP
jgi:hypothetical protein